MDSTPAPNQPLYQSIRNGYLPGARIQAELFGLDGAPLGTGRFLIQSYAGSGFAGQVYQAQPIQTPSPDLSQPVALKILKPRQAWRRLLRDLLFQVCFQCLFAARLREPAVRAGLLWQALLRAAANPTLKEGAVARPLAYYWDAGQAAYVEVHEWVASRKVRYQADDSLLLRRTRPVDPANQSASGESAPGSEMARKRAFMQSLVDLCRQAGAPGLARQYLWYTLVSPANVLSRVEPEPDGPEFTAIDFRPGLAAPFFLPISPAHLALILNGLPRGRLVYYDEIDLGRLKRFAHQPGSALRPGRDLIPHLRQAEAAYRFARPDVWQTRLGALRFRDRRRACAQALVEDWQRLGQVDAQSARRLKASRGLFWLAYLCGWLPLAGGLARTWGFHAGFRKHLKAWLAQPAYRRASLQAARDYDLAAWSAEGRISAARQARLERSLILYCLDRLTLGWLPARLQRILSDGAEFRRLLSALLVQPLRLMLRPAARLAWLHGVLRQQQRRGLISTGREQLLENQLKEPRLAACGRDLGVTLGLEVFSKTIYALLAAYGLASGDFLPLAVAALGPVPPSGLVRAGYVTVMLVGDLPGILRDKDWPWLVSRLLGLAVAPWRWVGNLFAPLEMFSSYPELSLLLAEHFVSHMVRAVPVLGGEGLLLEYWTFQTVFNLPLSLRRWLVEHWSREQGP